MPKKIDLEIKEDIVFLQKEYSKAQGPLKKDRIKTLLYIKSSKYHFHNQIAKKLARTEKTIRGWLQQYQRGGYGNLLEVKSGGNNTRTISEKAKMFIAEKVTNQHSTITSYIELQLLLEEELGEKIIYGALYSHCRRNHKTKPKVARKSHYKKDVEAEVLFKKP